MGGGRHGLTSSARVSLGALLVSTRVADWEEEGEAIACASVIHIVADFLHVSPLGKCW